MAYLSSAGSRRPTGTDAGTRITAAILIALSTVAGAAYGFVTGLADPFDPARRALFPERDQRRWSRRDSPSRRCSTIAVATTDGGIDRRPIAPNRSENISSGNNRSRSRNRNPYTELAGSDSSQNRVTGSNRFNCLGASPNDTDHYHRSSVIDANHVRTRTSIYTSHLGRV
jgi:hypothetical protein